MSTSTDLDPGDGNPEKLPLAPCSGGSYDTMDEQPAKQSLLRQACGAYEVWVVVLLALTYVFNQMDRLVIGVVATPMAQAIGYGDMSCVVANERDVEYEQYCAAASDSELCDALMTVDGIAPCEWNYNGQGIEYELLVGPVFNIVFATSGVFLGFAADYSNRKYILVVCSMVWSLVTIMTGAASTYLQLAFFRFMLGVAEAGCTPFATSLLGDFFADALLGTAVGVYNWGVDIGYSLAFAVGDYMIWNNIMGDGWRWAFYICGIPGIVVSLLMACTLVEPPRRPGRHEGKRAAEGKLEVASGCCGCCSKVVPVLREFVRWDLIFLCLACSLRKAAQWVWTYNAELFYNSQGQNDAQIGTYMCWIPAVGGAISLFIGGYISDRVSLRGGLVARIAVIISSQMLAAPFAAAVLVCPAPWSYYMLIPCMILGEMWIGISLAIVVEMVPGDIRTAIIAVFLFVVNNIAGLGPITVPPLQDIFEYYGFTVTESLEYSLLVLFPGGYVLAALFYLLALIAVAVQGRREKKTELLIR